MVTVDIALDKSWRTEIDKLSDAALLALCTRIEAHAVTLAPVDTGYLRGSIGYKTTTAQSVDLPVQPTKKDAYVGALADYAVYVEMGTRTQKAQPFLLPAVLHYTTGANVPEIIDAIKKYNTSRISLS